MGGNVGWKRGWALALLAVVLPFGPALAGDADAPPSPRVVAAEHVLELIAAGDADGLAAAAARDDPDPWWVAEELCRRGEREAAAAFAAAVTRPALDGLPAYVRERGPAPGTPAALTRMEKAQGLLESGKPEDARSALGEPSTGETDEVSPVARIETARCRARCEEAAGEGAGAGEIYRKAAADAEEIGWLLGAVRCRGDAAVCAQNAGDLDALEADFAAMAGLWDRLGDLPRRSGALCNAGLVASLRGDYRRALVTLASACDLLERLGDAPGARSTESQVLYNRSLIASWLGRFAEAIEFASRAREIQRRLNDRAGLVASANLLSTYHHVIGEDDRAGSYASEALRIATEAGDREGLATANVHLGLIERRRGRLEEAEKALETARDIYATLPDPGRANLAAAELALVAARRGRLDDAVSDLESALGKIGGPDARYETVYLRLQLGRVQLRRGDANSALEAFRAGLDDAVALGLLEFEAFCGRGAAQALLALGRAREAADEAWRSGQYMREASQGFAPTQLSGFREAAPEGEALALTEESVTGARAALALDDPGLLFRFVEAGRAATVLASLAEVDASKLRRRGVSAELTAEEARLREDEAAARHRLDEAIAGGERKPIRARRRELDEARAALRALVVRIRSSSRLAAGVLYPRLATLDELRSSLGPGTAWVAYRIDGDSAAALVATAEGAAIHELGDTREIVADCAAVRADGPSADPASGRLARALLESLDLPESVKTLLVVADDPIGSLPFARVLPGTTVVRVPSASAYLRLLAQRAERGTGVLAVGDPTTGGAPPPGLPSLPSAAAEARAVGDVVLVGDDATETVLRAALAAERKPPRRWRAVHLACHGDLVPAHPWSSALLLSPDAGNDGRLTAFELVGLDVDADLAVLSACESGRGTELRGEGLVGLAPAFLSAGCPRVIVSLWRVDDAATAALMKSFYAHFRKGESAAAALRRAQAELRRDSRWADARFWAGWQIWGLPD